MKRFYPYLMFSNPVFAVALAPCYSREQAQKRINRARRLHSEPTGQYISVHLPVHPIARSVPSLVDC